MANNISTVLIDIGARESDYLRVMERSEDEHVALILFDPLPDSFIPLAKRVAEYSMRNGGQKWLLDETKSRQVFLARAAVSGRE